MHEPAAAAHASTGHAVPPPPLSLTFIDEPDQVGQALHAIDAALIGVDVERADAHLYHRRAALIQIGVPGHCVLLDAITIDRFPEVDRFFGPDRIAILHAVENDLEPLAGRGIQPHSIADTAVAAAMLGLPIGLGALLAEVLQVELSGDKSAFQRADWSQRPLGPGMADYAAGDVVHLPTLWLELADRLKAADRWAWYQEELAATIGQARQNRREWSRVKGSARLSGEQRAILRALWETRERIAQEHDIAPNRLIHEDVLRDLATTPPSTEAQLVRRSQRHRALLREHVEPMMAALVAAQQGPPEPAEDHGRRITEADRRAYDAMRKARASVAKDVGLDAGVICSSKQLWSAVLAEPEDDAQLCAAGGLRNWQAQLLRSTLWETYTEAIRGADQDAQEDQPI